MFLLRFCSVTTLMVSVGRHKCRAGGLDCWATSMLALLLLLLCSSTGQVATVSDVTQWVQASTIERLQSTSSASLHLQPSKHITAATHTQTSVTNMSPWLSTSQRQNICSCALSTQPQPSLPPDCVNPASTQPPSWLCQHTSQPLCSIVTAVIEG